MICHVTIVNQRGIYPPPLLTLLNHLLLVYSSLQQDELSCGQGYLGYHWGQWDRVGCYAVEFATVSPLSTPVMIINRAVLGSYLWQIFLVTGSMGALCSTYMVVLLPHSKKVLGFASELWQGCSLWSVHVLPVLSWCSSECSGFPHYQNMYLRLILLSVTLNKALAKIWSRSLGAVCWLHTAPRVLVRSHYAAQCMIVSNKIMILLLPM